MKGVNKVILVCTLGQDPELKTFGNGGQIANVSAATSESWIDKNSGENKQVTEWHKLVFNGKLAEIVQQYLRKGSKIYVEGKLSTRKWTDQSGQDRYVTEIKCDQMQMLDSKPQDSGGQRQQPQARPQAQSQHSDLNDPLPF